jgi:glycosyltransferase involved in cell wall biosynthesis
VGGTTHRVTRKHRQLRILFVTARYLPSVGGTEIHAHEVGTRLVEAGHQVTILTIDTTGALCARERLDGVEVVRVPAWPRSTEFGVSPALYRAVREAPVDLVHVHGYYTLVGPLSMSAALRADLPYVLTFHGRGHSSPLRTKLRRLQEFTLRPLFLRADCLVALTEREGEVYRRTLRLPESLLAIIPGGANVTGLDDAGETAVDPNLIVSLGRAERLKGHQKIVAALPEIAAAHPGIKLRVCGEGPFAGDLWRLATRLGVADRLEIGAIPFAEREQFVRTLQSAALVVSLSESEAQGLAALEAAYLGRPLLVTTASGLTELVDAGIATGVSPRAGPDVVARAVLDQLEQPRTPAQLHLPTWDECVQQLEVLYASVLRKRQ